MLRLSRRSAIFAVSVTAEYTRASIIAVVELSSLSRFIGAVEAFGNVWFSSGSAVLVVSSVDALDLTDSGLWPVSFF